MVSARFLTSDDRTLFAECGNVFIAYSTHQETPSTFALAEGHIHSLVGRHPGGIGFLFLIDHTEGPPPGFLERARTVLAPIEREMIGVACVVLTQGFAASIYRSTGAAFIALSGKRSLLHMCGEMDGGSRWLSGRLAHLPGTPTSGDLAAAGEAVIALRGSAS